MADITLGTVPKKLRVVLVSGADFVTGLRREVSGVPTDWDVGTELSLEFNDEGATTFDAVITDDLAQWNESEATVDTLIAASPTTVKLWYVNGALNILWASGEVEVAT